MTQARIAIQLTFSQELGNAKQECERASQDNNFNELVANIRAYKHWLEMDLRRNFLQTNEAPAEYNTEEFEVHPDLLVQFGRQIDGHIEAIYNYQLRSFKLLDVHEQEEVQVALEEMRQGLRNVHQIFREQSKIDRIVLSNNELWIRFYWRVAGYTGKITLTVGACTTCYFVPPLLLANPSFWASIGTYAAVSSVSSGLNTVGANAIDGEGLTNNIGWSMLIGGVVGGFSGGIAGWGTTVEQTGKTIQKGTQLKSSIVKMLKQKGSKVALYKTPKIVSESSSTLASTSSATATTSAIVTTSSRTLGLEATAASIAHLSRGSQNAAQQLEEAWRNYENLIEYHMGGLITEGSLVNSPNHLFHHTSYLGQQNGFQRPSIVMD